MLRVGPEGEIRGAHWSWRWRVFYSSRRRAMSGVTVFSVVEVRRVLEPGSRIKYCRHTTVGVFEMYL